MAISRTPLTIQEQRALILKACPSFWTLLEKGELLAQGDVQPTSRSPVYKVRILYRIGEIPKVTVLSPPLVPREEDGGIPHMYVDKRLCLYMPDTDEWTADLSLADTIIPWTVEWLFHYEMWRATGKWSGGGKHPPRKEDVA
jgi:hypothetical protein